MSTKDDFILFLKSKHPTLDKVDLGPLVADFLISLNTVEMPKAVLTQAQEFVAAAFAMRENKTYQKHYEQELKTLGIIDPGNKAIAMSYDFHLDADKQLKLIEINTNAAFLGLSLEMYEFRKQTPPLPFTADDLKKSIESEMQLAGKMSSMPKVAIIDEAPELQRLYIEFLIYRSYFLQWGWPTQILDFSKVTSDFNFIYNRYTDFYLSEPKSLALKGIFNNRESTLSPNPFEYFLLADKQRMIDWSAPGFVEQFVGADQARAIRNSVPRAFALNSENVEEIWTKRKTLFFKPKRAFGSKQSFRGSSISRKAFEEICNDNFVAQEFIEAPENTYETPAGPHKFKYDLRFYAYQGQVQTVVARLYQGQVTNLRTPHGGFACVKFI